MRRKMTMIEKGVYVLLGIKEQFLGKVHPEEVIWPCEPYGIPDYLIQKKPTYFTDYADVQDFIKKHLGLTYKKIVVCKVADYLETSIKTAEKMSRND